MAVLTEEALWLVSKSAADAVRGWLLRQGKPMTENQVSYFFAKLSDACHSRFSSHRYRYTVATELMQKPEQNLYVTQKLLGHRDIKVTLSYD